MISILIVFFIGIIIAPNISGADVTICGEDPRTALNNLPPGEDLLLCPEVTHDFGGGFTQLGDMQGSFVRSSVPGVLAPASGLFIFINSATHNLTFSELHMTGSGSGHAFRVDAGSTNITVQDSIIENYSLASYVKANSPGVKDIKIHRNIIRNNHSQGVLGGCPGYEVLNNVFIDNGNNGVFDHDIYFGCKDNFNGEPCPTLIKNNYLTGSSRDSNGDCYASQIVTHGYVNGLVIENNIIAEPDGYVDGHCYGIDISQLSGNDYPMKNVIIRNNTIINQGRVGIRLLGVIGTLIENNILWSHDSRHTGGHVAVDLDPSSGSGGGDIEITKNIIDYGEGRLSSGGAFQISSGATGPILITNNTQSYDDRSYFDVDDDGSVGSGDIYTVLENLGSVGTASDLNQDGAVGVDDLGMILRIFVALSYEELYYDS
jgi:hypothetical protein